jgi:Icc protein
MIIAQISDMHVVAPGKQLYGAIDTAAYLARAIDALAALKPAPDVALVTGDLVNAGSPAEYASLRAELERLPFPYRLIPGNHDARDGMRAAFPDHDYLGTSGFIQYVDDSFAVRLIGLDSLDDGKVPGRLCRDRLAWLERMLATSDRPTVIFVHHPPYLTGMGHMDGQPLDGAFSFAAIVERHPNIERVLAGHVHRSTQARWAGTMASTCPSTAHQFVLDLNPGKRLDYALEPPGFQLHVWQKGGPLVTHTVPIGQYEARRLV